MSAGTFRVVELTQKAFDSIMDRENVNSWRFYSGLTAPVDYLTGATGVFYLKGTSVLDAVELVPKVRRWIDNTSQSMGNWVSREDVLDRLRSIDFGPVSVSRGEMPLEQLNGILSKNQALTVIGFDRLQVPRCKITFRRE